MTERLILQLSRGLKQKTASDSIPGETDFEETKLTISRKLDHISVTNLPNSTTKGGSNHTKVKAFNFDKRNGLKYTMPLCHFDSYNLWILKPTHLNCGRGIHVFRDLESFNKLVKQYCIGKDQLKKKAYD